MWLTLSMIWCFYVKIRSIWTILLILDIPRRLIPRPWSLGRPRPARESSPTSSTPSWARRRGEWRGAGRDSLVHCPDLPRPRGKPRWDRSLTQMIVSSSFYYQVSKKKIGYRNFTVCDWNCGKLKQLLLCKVRCVSDVWYLVRLILPLYNSLSVCYWDR